MVLRITQVITLMIYIHMIFEFQKEKISFGNSYCFLIFLKVDVLETANGTVGNDIVRNDTEIHRREEKPNLTNGVKKQEPNNWDVVRIYK